MSCTVEFFLPGDSENPFFTFELPYAPVFQVGQIITLDRIVDVTQWTIPPFRRANFEIKSINQSFQLRYNSRLTTLHFLKVYVWTAE